MDVDITSEITKIFINDMIEHGPQMVNEDKTKMNSVQSIQDGWCIVAANGLYQGPFWQMIDVIIKEKFKWIDGTQIRNYFEEYRKLAENE